MPYDPRLVQPMREELTCLGVDELLTADDVQRWMDQSGGTGLLIFNSVCGCAAGSARPGVAMALQHGVTPTRTATVFAGQDVEAVAKARSFLADVPPSSPSMALFKDGEMVHFVPRHRIEGQSPEGVAAQLTAAFDAHCAATSGS